MQPVAAAYRLTASDTPTTVATTLAGAITGASASGAVLTLPTSLNAAATVVADTTALREMRRQEQGVRVSIWAPTPAVRDALASACDLAMASLTDAHGNITEFIPLQLGDSVRVRYRSTFTDDKPGKAHVWRRDICYLTEYPTTVAQAFPLMLFGGGKLTVGANPAVQYGDPQPV